MQAPSFAADFQSDKRAIWIARGVWLIAVLVSAAMLREGSLAGSLAAFAFLIGLAQFSSP